MPGCSAQLTPSYLAAFSKCPRNGSKRCQFPVEEGAECLEVKVSLKAAPAELGLLPRTGPGRLVLWSVALGKKVRELQAVGLLVLHPPCSQWLLPPLVPQSAACDGLWWGRRGGPWLQA